MQPAEWGGTSRRVLWFPSPREWRLAGGGVHIGNPYLSLLFIFLSLLLAACGGAPTETAQLPTATTIPTFAYVAPTSPPSVATAAAATQTAQAASSEGSLDPEAVERGRTRYEALACAECHGENGEGVDEVSPLSASVQTEDEFIAFMRSGGDIGPEHQFASNRLSASGGRNLYQYLLSLREGG